MHIDEVKPKGANRYSTSTGVFYIYAFKGLVSKKWNGRQWVNSTVPADAIRIN